MRNSVCEASPWEFWLPCKLKCTCVPFFFRLGANIFLTSSGLIKLGDFGCSVKLKNNAQTMPGEVNSTLGTAGRDWPDRALRRRPITVRLPSGLSITPVVSSTREQGGGFLNTFSPRVRGRRKVLLLFPGTLSFVVHMGDV